MAKVKKNLTARSIRAIRKMVAAVLNNPREFDQNLFPDPWYDTDGSEKIVCRTAYCAAGHGIAANKPRLFKQLLKQEADGGLVFWDAEAAAVLGVTDCEYGTLFGSASDWPEKFNRMYLEADSAKTERGVFAKRAKAFKARWEHFIKVDGVEEKDFAV